MSSPVFNKKRKRESEEEDEEGEEEADSSESEYSSGSTTEEQEEDPSKRKRQNKPKIEETKSSEKQEKQGEQRLFIQNLELKPFHSPKELYNVVKEAWNSYDPTKSNEISFTFLYPIYNDVRDDNFSHSCPPKQFQMGKMLGEGVSKSVNVLKIVNQLTLRGIIPGPFKELVITSERFTTEKRKNLGICSVKMDEEGKKIDCGDSSFSEIICATMLQFLTREFSPSYVIYYGFLHCSEAFFTIQERMEETLYHFLQKDNLLSTRLGGRGIEMLITNLFLQVTYGIYLMQKKYKMVHNDLHHQNVLIKALESFSWKGTKLDDFKFFGYRLRKNKTIYFVNSGFLAKIADFGLAVSHDPHVTNDDISTGTYDTYGIKDEFDGMYDILMFTSSLYSVLSDLMNDKEMQPLTQPVWMTIKKLLDSMSKILYKAHDFEELRINYFTGNKQKTRPIGLPYEYTIDNFMDVFLKYTKDGDRRWTEFPSDVSKENVYVF